MSQRISQQQLESYADRGRQAGGAGQLGLGAVEGVEGIRVQ